MNGEAEKAVLRLADEGVVRLPQDPDGGEALLTGMVRGALMRVEAESRDPAKWQPLVAIKSVVIGSDYTTSVRVTMRSGDYLVTVRKL